MTTPQREFEDVSILTEFSGLRNNRSRDLLSRVSLKLQGSLVPIAFKARLLERHQVCGQTDFYNENILLDANLTEAETLSTILHEIMEFLNKKHKLGLEHDIICSLEALLFDVMANNPAYIEVLLDYARRYTYGSEAEKIES